MYLGKSKETLDITMGGTLDNESAGNGNGNGIKEADQPVSTGDESTAKPTEPSEEIPAAPGSQPALDQKPPQRPTTSSGWLGGWLGWSTVQPPKEPETTPQDDSKVAEQAPETEQEVLQPVQQAQITPAENIPKLEPAPQASTSWFGLWSTAAPSTAVAEAPKEQIPVKVPDKDKDNDTVMEDAPVPKAVEPAAGSSWAFWSTDTSKKTMDPKAKTEDTGELAVAGEASQNHPEPAKTATVKEDKKAKPSKRGRPQSLEVDEAARKTAQLDPPSAKGTPSQSPAPAKALPPNLLIPSVRSTYHLVENPSILQQIARLLLRGNQQPVKHVFLVKEPPKIKKALAIGIHGLFPAPLLRTVIGQPTGTSIRFANHAADAIRRWTDAHGSVDCEIEKVALEGEGKIGDRADNLWKLLLNWIDHVRKADFIMVACHSQGVPVALMLVAKLIEFGVVSTGKIGVCAMGKSFSWETTIW
jgi:hypothetical protein